MPVWEFDAEYADYYRGVQIRVLQRDVRMLKDMLRSTLPSQEVQPTPKPQGEWISIKEAAQLVQTGATLQQSERTIRWWAYRDTMEFRTRCCTRRGRRVLIERAALMDWLADGGARNALLRK